MSRNHGRYRLLFSAACIVLVAYEMWTFFVRETPAVSIQGQHRRLIDEFGRGAGISQAFLMIGNRLSALEVQFATDRPLTLLVRCELSRIEPPGSFQAVSSYTWFATIKRLSGVERRRISFPSVETSNAQTYIFRLQLIRAVPSDDSALQSMLEAPSDRSPRVAVVASKENIPGGGALWISDQRQLGSLSLRAFTRARTAYQRFRADVAPVLPPALRNPAVGLVIVIAYQWALAGVVYALLIGTRDDRFAGSRTRDDSALIAAMGARSVSDQDPLTTARRRPLCVLLVTGAYAPEISSGGLQSQMMARALSGRVEFTVLTTAVDPALPRQAVVDGVPVSRIGVDVSSRRSKIRAARRMTGELIRLLRRADVVHIQGISQKNVLVTAIAKLLGVPVVLSLQTAGFDEPEAVASHGALARWAFGAVDLYLGVSPRLVEACRAANLPSHKVRLVPNAVDLQRFRPAAPGERDALCRSLGIATGRPIVLFVGFFSRDKQPHVLFDAWLRLQREPLTASTLLLVGATRAPYFEVDDRLAEEMRNGAQRAGVADRLIFVEPTHRIHEYYRVADVFVLPSLREGLPIVLLEAMASGLAAVASRLPGSTDAVIDDGRTGVLVAPGDVNGFADAIGRLLTDHERAAALGEAARRRVAADFSAERVASQWVDAYRDVTGNE